MKSELESLIEKMIAGGILFDEAVKEFEKHFILRVLASNSNNLSKAAEELGIHRNTLTKRLQEYERGSGAKKKALNNRRQVTSRRKTRIQNLSR